MSRVLDNKRVKVVFIIMFITFLFIIMIKPCYAAVVSGVIEKAWNSAETQIKNVVNNVVFPVIDLVLAVFFFVRILTIGNRGNSNGQHQLFYLRVFVSY